jgi:predicted enzyme related to lactoylglutathione lyase
MGERTSYEHGAFSWVELATTDQDAAKSFYAELFGWEYDDNPVADGVVYSMAKLEGRYVGAINPQQAQERAMGVPPNWKSYITVDDVDAVSARVSELGGNLLAPPFDVMDVGRMSVLMDPTGAVVSLWQAKSHIGAGVVNVPGAFCWNELGTRDPKAAEDFYSALLGWTFEPSQEAVGPPYWMIRNGERWNAGMRLMGEETPAGVPSHWLVYFAVDSVKGAAERAAALEAQILVPRMDVGERGAFAALTDPQGAAFALFEGRLDP